MSHPRSTLLLITLLASCGPTDQGPADPGLPSGAPLELGPPRLSVGVLEGDPVEIFDGVRSPFLLPDGRLVVPLTGSSEVRVFDADGRFVESHGGQGEGPGEFVRLRSAWPRGDTIEVWDSGARRITRFVPDGRPDVVGVRAEVPLDGGLGALGDGWALVAATFGDVRDRMSVHAVARGGAHEGEIAGMEGMARYRTPAVIGPHPVTPTALAVIAGDEVVVGDGIAPTLRVHDRSGALVRQIPLLLEPTGAPADVFEAVVDSAVAAAPDDPTLRERLEAFPSPGALPLYWDLIADPEGFLWVRPWEPFRHALALGGRPGGQGEGGSWVVLTTTGTPAGRIELPEGVQPTWIDRDAVVGIHRDAYGVESVRVYPLIRNSR